jgi:hypothetical protein
MAGRELRFTRNSPLSPWLPVCTGLLAAEVTASVICTLPAPFHHWLPKLVARALLYVTATVAAAIAGTMLPGWLTDRTPQPATPVLARLCFSGWVFFPAIVLLYRQHSVLLLAAVAAACVPLAISLQRLSALADPEPLRTATLEQGTFPSLYGLPAPDYNPLVKFLIAGLLAGAAAFAVKQVWSLAALCFAGAVFLATWRWTALTSHMRHRRRPGSRARIQLCAAATFLAFFAMLLWSVQAGPVAHGSIAHKQPSNSRSPITTGIHPPADYVGVILLPPKLEKKEIVVPAPRTPAITLGLAKPVVIPFDGPYWFFKAPARRPAKEAHIARGKATEVNVHSSDLDPLRMEAHQALGSVVDLRCCSALDLKVLNADKRPGTIDLGILLTDTTAPGRPSLYLGDQTLPSSTPLVIPHDRAPVEETLHFTIPREAHSLRFNEITVLFRTAPFHARYAAKVQIRNFVLIPR